MRPVMRSKATRSSTKKFLLASGRPRTNWSVLPKRCAVKSRSCALSRTCELANFLPIVLKLDRASVPPHRCSQFMPNPSFRKPQQAIEDAKKACSITQWREADSIDTLAVACAKSGDFESAVRYVEKAMQAYDAAEMTKRSEEHTS